MDFAFLNAQLLSILRGAERVVDMQSASMHYMYLVGLYSRRRCDFAGFVENVESCDLCILSCWGSSSSALICCAQLSWTCSVLQLLLNSRKQQEGTMCLLQSWHKTGFGNQARTNRHTFHLQEQSDK